MRLLIIGDLSGQFATARRIANSRGAKVTQAADIETALTVLRSGQGADLIMIDVQQPIHRLIIQLEQERIVIPVIGCGFSRDKEAAVKAIESGAKEYLPLPPDEELIAGVLETLSTDPRALVFQSQAMQQVVTLAEQIAPSDATVLITGKSGTGKEMIARHVYEKSKRAHQPFITLNCAAIPDHLLESELFGHEKGAFTGAVARRIGKFEEANHGTILLDEISEMDLRLQAKLLRAIQEKEIDRIGGSKPVQLNIRIIATSNRDLQQEVIYGRFREDLYFRLNIITLHLPALEKRKEDIPALARHFIEKYAKANNIPVKPLDKEALELLQQHDWPGNIRELENTMYRAILLARDSHITAANLMMPSTSTQPLRIEPRHHFIARPMASVEKEHITNTVKHCLGNYNQAAELLGISIASLKRKLQTFEESLS